VAVPVLAALPGCTDLDENPTSTISPDNYYRNEQEIRGGLAGVYSSLRAVHENYWPVVQVSTDETVVPTRGTDWFDNGKWIELHRQTWTPNSAIALDDINGMWNGLFAGVARANVVLAALKPNTIPDQVAVESELRALRAFYYYLLLDTFGNVPLVTDVEVTARAQAPRDSVFRFIESELVAARTALPARRPAADYGRLTQGSVDAILASLYLNAEVYAGQVTPAGLTRGTARWADAVSASDRILNSGVYSLAAEWRSNFTPNNEASPEIIFAVRNTPAADLGLRFLNRSAHYNHYSSPGGWNGFSALAETYNAFEATDQRRSIFLVGPQNSLETGSPINDRQGNRLVLSPTIRDVTQAAENEGVRVVKFPYDPAHFAEQMGNDFPIFRLAEIYLIKAEALNELGRTGEAVALVNQVRARVNPTPVAAASQAAFRQVILRERLFELNNEGKRRTDMIRAGIFTAPFQFKEQREPYRILFPIPQTQIQTNPLLVQNPGY
jgi:hypothetical protein